MEKQHREHPHARSHLFLSPAACSYFLWSSLRPSPKLSQFFRNGFPDLTWLTWKSHLEGVRSNEEPESLQVMGLGMVRTGLWGECQAGVAV